MSPFLAWGDFHARSRFARSTIPEEKWGTTRSLVHGYHCLGDMAVRMREILAGPWVGVCVPIVLPD